MSDLARLSQLRDSAQARIMAVACPLNTAFVSADRKTPLLLMEAERLAALAVRDAQRLLSEIQSQRNALDPPTAARAMFEDTVNAINRVGLKRRRERIILADGLSASFGTPQAERTNP